jgi:hypothetical protein
MFLALELGVCCATSLQPNLNAEAKTDAKAKPTGRRRVREHPAIIYY